MAVTSLAKDLVKWMISNEPRLQPVADSAYRSYQNTKVRALLEKRKLSNKYPAPVDPHSILSVDPNVIMHQSNPYFDSWEMAGVILDGDWDKDPTLFEETPIYKSLYDRFVDDCDWEETLLYKAIDTKFVNNPDESNWGFDSISTFERRLDELEQLYNQINQCGYKSQKELEQSATEDPISNRAENDTKRKLDEVTVNIDRRGRLLCNHGRHRLSLAKILDVDSIPVRVVVRHEEWQDFRDELTLKIRMGDGEVYNQVPHIDFQHLDARHRSGARWQCIDRHLEISSGTVLDIGSKWGYFCHQFESKGFDCIAVEHDSSNAEMIERFRDANGRNFKVLNRDIFEINVKSIDYGVVLALNIFHHFLKTEEGYQELKRLLKDLDAEVLYFQSHAPGEKQMEGAYRSLVGDSFADFLVDSSSFESWEYIGTPEENGRRMYKIT